MLERFLDHDLSEGSFGGLGIDTHANYARFCYPRGTRGSSCGTPQPIALLGLIAPSTTCQGRVPRPQFPGRRRWKFRCDPFSDTVTGLFP
jgi:hypothetical protein